MSDANGAAARVAELIGQMSPLGEREAQADDRLIEDLGYDSLSIIELALALESEFSLPRIPEEDAMDVVTVGHVQELVTNLLGAKAPS